MTVPNNDRYAAELTGPYLRFNSLEGALLYARNVFPQLYVEGSTGFERTFWVRTDNEPTLIGHAWMTGRKKEVWHLRLKDILNLKGR